MLPNKCIFCGGPGPLTREDVWPVWLQKFIPTAPRSTPRDHRQAHVISYGTSFDVGLNYKRGRFAQPGTSLTKRLKVVCATCNNGWMSCLQTLAKPHLMPLMLGDWVGFSREAQYAIAAWATMFTMVWDFTNMHALSISQGERTEFYVTKKPPPNWIVSFGFTRNFMHHGASWKIGFKALRTTVDGHSKMENFQTTTFMPGRLLLHTFSGPPDSGVTPASLKAELGTEVIWPDLVWPIPHPWRTIFGQAGYGFVAGGLSRLYRQNYGLPFIDGRWQY